MLYKHVYAICFIILLINSHCSQRTNSVYKSPDGYNLNTPFLVNLPVELDKISGIAFYPKYSSVFAIGDEYFNPGNQRFERGVANLLFFKYNKKEKT